MKKEIQQTKFQYFSDVHLEDHTSLSFDFPVVSDTLLLGGDIGNIRLELTKETLKNLAHAFTNVVYILGNHEYYQGSFEDPWPMEVVESETLKFCSMYPNLHFLNKSSWTHPSGIQILGCTLWSHIPNKHKLLLQSTINDYQNIYTLKGQTITTKDTNRLFSTNFAWLQSIIPQNVHTKTVVVTHYVPSFKLCDTLPKDKPIKHIIATELDSFIESNENIVAWVCGHFHKETSTVIGKTYCTINPISRYPKGTGMDIGALSKTFTVQQFWEFALQSRFKSQDKKLWLNQI
eukprot:TRINITY_DN45431_c0_g1_i2.p1 TRINITY_DN45431_c0_g1~~TRINITY_DN45431_c0_g1_i2.p1  ORF type:complete len:302 (+),score=-0.84 TRINITY_DN45431_c0_g1_i2:38-907(+)